MRYLASAAPGSDILCHEVCSEFGIDSVVCLPMPKDVCARSAFGDFDYWRSRYLELIGRRPLLQLSNQEGLPRWLEGSGIDPWERGNRWVLEMAQTRGAKKYFDCTVGRQDHRRRAGWYRTDGADSAGSGNG